MEELGFIQAVGMDLAEVIATRQTGHPLSLNDLSRAGGAAPRGWAGGVLQA